MLITFCSNAEQATEYIIVNKNKTVPMHPKIPNNLFNMRVLINSNKMLKVVIKWRILHALNYNVF